MLIFNSYKYDYTWPGIKAIIEDAESINIDEKKKLKRNLFIPVAKGIPGTFLYILYILVIVGLFFIIPDKYEFPILITFWILITIHAIYRRHIKNSKKVIFPLGIEEYVEKLNNQYNLNIVIDHTASH